MTTFTLPYELRALARKRPKALYQLMFSVSASLLKDFAKRNTLGAIGFTSVLHTHSRRRELHPHLPIIVANGGYDTKKKQWKKGQSGRKTKATLQKYTLNGTIHPIKVDP